MNEPTHIPTDADWDALIARLAARATAPDRTATEPPAAESSATAGTMMTRAEYSRDICPTAYDQLSAWLAERTAGTMHRGLWLWGPAGLGKSLFLASVLGLRPLTAAQIVDCYREYGGYDARFAERVYGSFNDANVRIVPQPLTIDDLGQEPLSVLFGVREEVLCRVLCDRYEHWQRHAVRTYITTNQTPEQIDARYGRRVTDRLTEMCVAVEFAGKSARQEA
jgi:hypothetical protein